MKQQCMICKSMLFVVLLKQLLLKVSKLFWPQAFNVMMDLRRRWRLLHLLYCIRNAENSTHDRVVSKLQRGKMNFHHMHQEQLLEKD